VDLGTLGGHNSGAVAVNHNGQVVGTSDLDNGVQHAFSWTPATGMMDLGTFGGPSSSASAVNDSGHVVGDADLPQTGINRPHHAFSWTPTGGMVDLGTLGTTDFGISYSIGAHVNNSGQVVGYSSAAGASSQHAFSWTPATGMTDLGTPEGTSSEPNAVNDSGQIVGRIDCCVGGNVSSRATLWLPVTTTLLALAAVPDTSVFGQQISLTATLTAGFGTPTGTINFFDGAVSLGTAPVNVGSATLNVSTLSVGPHNLSATYSSDNGFQGSSSSTVTVSVNMASTVTTLESAPNPSQPKQTVEFTAAVSAVAPGGGVPTGQVQFADGKKILGTAALSNGVASLSVAFNGMAPHSIMATYAGNANFLGSTSPTIHQTVSKK